MTSPCGWGKAQIRAYIKKFYHKQINLSILFASGLQNRIDFRMNTAIMFNIDAAAKFFP